MSESSHASGRTVGGPAMSRPVAIAAHILLVLVGAVVGLLAAFVSRAVWRPGELALPWGLVLSLAGSVAGVRLAAAWRVSAGFAAAAGWAVGVAVLVPGGPGGDLIIINDVYGNTLLLGGLLVVVLAAGWGGWRR